MQTFRIHNDELNVNSIDMGIFENIKTIKVSYKSKKAYIPDSMAKIRAVFDAANTDGSDYHLVVEINIIENYNWRKEFRKAEEDFFKYFTRDDFNTIKFTKQVIN